MSTLLWTLAGGRVRIDSASGAPLQFEADADPERRYLLDRALDAWHTPEQRWGSGFVITDRGSARWNAPGHVQTSHSASSASHHLLDDLTLHVTRSVGAGLTETYRFDNSSGSPIALRSVGIGTPFRDVYGSSEDALNRAVHAHLWTAGKAAWVLAQPMSGAGPVLALRLRAGQLSAYSIESRNLNTNSNIRGHIILQPTDAARNPSSFGGQEAIVIDAGSSFEVSWDVEFLASAEEFEALLTDPIDRIALHHPVGRRLELPAGARVLGLEGKTDVHVQTDGGVTTLVADSHQVCDIELDGVRTAVLFHDDLKELVVRRIRFILERQRATERRAPGSAAMVPYDTETGLTRFSNGWSDWSDGAERIAMPTLIQQAVLRGWVGVDEVGGALRDWATFAREQLVDESWTVLWGSFAGHLKPRLYNVPWLAHFFVDHYRIFGEPGDLEASARILERGIELGSCDHLAIGWAEAILSATRALRAVGQIQRAERLEQHVVSSADKFVGLDIDLPAHEVNYEQSMVAPLLSLLSAATRISGDDRFLPHLRVVLRWLRAFSGPQPHIRLKRVAIRHWDGYWFGKNRLWGDTFPHHWSTLTAVALHQLPASERTAELVAEAREIFMANLTLFHSDGSGTAAFVFASTVDGRPAHRADPIANDQDWALTLLLRHGADLIDESLVCERAEN